MAAADDDTGELALEQGFTLDDWYVEPMSGCVSRGDSRQHVEPKVMDVLLCLARARGEVVTRDELFNSVWTGLVVSEEVLTRAVSELRTLLGDTQRERRYVRTVPKRGYALIAEVHPRQAPSTRPAVVPSEQHYSSPSSAPSFSQGQNQSSENSPAKGDHRGQQSRSGDRRASDSTTSISGSPVETFGTVKRLALVAVVIVAVLMVYMASERGPLKADTSSSSSVVSSVGNVQPSLADGSAGLSFGDSSEVLQGNDGEPTLAVLPFINFGSSANQSIFTDGLSEDIRSALMEMSGIKVVARTSSQAFKDKALDVREIGRQLGVKSLVEGTVRLLGNAARITIQLTNTESGFPSWSKTYDRNLDDIFSVQREIAEDVARQLAPQLSLVASERTTTSQQAHNLYLLGRNSWHQRTPESVSRAIESFEQAIAEDSQYALAYSGLADAHVFSHLYGPVDMQLALQRAQVAVAQALKLDSNLAEAHASQGLIYGSQEQVELARVSYEKAVKLKPSYTMAKMWYGSTLLELSEIDLAYSQFQEALTIDPLHPVIQQNYLEVLTVMGRYNDALKLATDMYRVSGHERLLKGVMHAFAGAGRYDELLQFAVRHNFSKEYKRSATYYVIDSLIELQRFDEAAQLFPQLIANTENPWDSYFLQIKMALGQRDSAAIRSTVEQMGSSGDLVSKWMDPECLESRKFYWLGLAGYMDSNMELAVSSFLQARERGFMSCKLDEDIKISLLIYLGDSLRALDREKEAMTNLQAAQSRLDHAMAKGWGHTALRGSEIALLLIDNNLNGLQVLAGNLEDEKVQPWSNIITHPIFDRYIQNEQALSVLAPFRDRFEQTQLLSNRIQLAKFGL